MWRLLDLGPVDGYTMTNLYEAVGIAVGSNDSPNTIILNHPESVFVNIGYHQLMEKEINIDYARSQGFDLVRRTIGGGAILDGPWEQDYFVVVNRKSPDCPSTVPDFYLKFLEAPLRALGRLGIEARIRPPNDIIVGEKKISGNGAISINGAMVLAGDLLIQVPSDLMSNIIKAPSEKFQDKLAESMQQWLTSIEDEVGERLGREKVKEALVSAFEETLFTELKPGDLTQEEKRKLDGLVEERRTEEWIFNKDNNYHQLLDSSGVKGTKVRGGISVSEAVHKAGKMIRIVLISKEDTISGLSISGDFFTQPYTGALKSLENSLIGARLERGSLNKTVLKTFEDHNLKTFGVGPEDFVEAILKAKMKI